jgi:hypothetical protein
LFAAHPPEKHRRHIYGQYYKGKCWTQFYKYVKRRKVNRENISAITDCNGRPIADSIEKANSLNSYYVSVYGCERNIPSEPFTINIKMIRKRLAATEGNKSVGLGGVPDEILKMSGQA